MTTPTKQTGNKIMNLDKINSSQKIGLKDADTYILDMFKAGLISQEEASKYYALVRSPYYGNTMTPSRRYRMMDTRFGLGD